MQNVYENIRGGVQIISVFNDANDAWLKIYQNIDSAESNAKYVFRAKNHYMVTISTCIGERFDCVSFIDTTGMVDSHDIAKIGELFNIVERHYGC